MLDKPRRWDQTLGLLSYTPRLGPPNHASNTKQIFNDYLLLLLSKIFGRIKKARIIWIRPVYSRNYKIFANFKNWVALIPFLFTKNLKRENIKKQNNDKKPWWSTYGICISRFHRFGYGISTCQDLWASWGALYLNSSYLIP